MKPGASRAAVGGRRGDALLVAVTSRAVEGQATEAALRAVASAFGVPRRDVRLVTGATSRDKVIDIEGAAAALTARHRELAGQEPSTSLGHMNQDRPAAASSDKSARRVADNPGKSRYEILAGGDLAGFVTYRLRGNVIAFLHTETELGFKGAGLASQLVLETLDDARRRHLSVLPFCPYVAGWIQRHPEYTELVPADRRPDFDLA